jgi:hypothetical protein
VQHWNQASFRHDCRLPPAACSGRRPPSSWHSFAATCARPARTRVGRGVSGNLDIVSSSEADQMRPVPAVDAWRLLTTPMTRDEADQAARAVEERVPHVDAVPIDPRQYLVLAWDRWGVEMIREALGDLSAAGRPVPERLLQASPTGWPGPIPTRTTMRSGKATPERPPCAPSVGGVLDPDNVHWATTLSRRRCSRWRGRSWPGSRECWPDAPPATYSASGSD